MKTYKFPIYILTVCAALFFVACSNDDDNIIDQSTCDDGLQNGDEEGVDCGGTVCEPCAMGLDFSGTFVQEDAMGRPAINTVFGGSGDVKNFFNVVAISERQNLQEGQTETFQQTFQNTLELYHDVYGASLGVDLDYETNILGLDAATFTTVLANFDALQVAPQGVTTYFDGVNVLTGRTINDDVVDISLTLIFGGMTGTRFDGNNDTPQLTTDGIDFGDREVDGFPYLQAPNN